MTGAAGFIGSAFVRQRFSQCSRDEILALDLLTYAGNLENLAPVSRLPGFEFERLDIRDADAVHAAFRRYRPEVVVHCAAESHVDRSIMAPLESVSTNVQGTAVLLEAAREYRPRLFLHVSTDEVYGSVAAPSHATEDWPLRPASPYSAAKAGSDCLAISYCTTFSVPVIVSRACNTYGPYQFPEKLIPLMVANALDSRPLPVYGDGMQVRDWLHVEDHCRALGTLIDKGRPGEIYNVAGDAMLPNLEVVRSVLRLCDKPESLIQYVTDRPGHDRRYALSSEKLKRQTSWRPSVEFAHGLRSTVDWYLRNRGWVDRIRSGEYRDYYERNYTFRGG